MHCGHDIHSFQMPQLQAGGDKTAPDSSRASSSSFSSGTSQTRGSQPGNSVQCGWAARHLCCSLEWRWHGAEATASGLRITELWWCCQHESMLINVFGPGVFVFGAAYFLHRNIFSGCFFLSGGLLSFSRELLSRKLSTYC